MLSAGFLGTNPLTKYFFFLHEQSFLLGIWAWGPGIPNHLSLSLQWFPRATVEVLPLSNILLRNSLSSVVGEPDHPFEDLEICHPTYSETMGFYVQYPILEQERIRIEAMGLWGTSVLCRTIPFPAIPSFNIFVLFFATSC